MHITVCIPTRDRGARIAPTLISLARSTYPDWDAVVVDQSATGETERAFAEATRGDGRFRYIRSGTSGSSRARNIAAACARGPLVAFTDDDCTVAPDWLACLVRHFERDPRVGQISGAVHAASHDVRQGFVPDYPIARLSRIGSPWFKWREAGMGANMAFRLAVLQAVGPFDELLGPGAVFHACLDGDMTYRVLKAGFVVLNAPDARVVHHGLRTWAEGRRQMMRTGTGVGAAYMKHLRLGDLAVLPTLLIEAVRCVSWRRLPLLRPRSGLARLRGYLFGAGRGFRYPLDPAGAPTGRRQAHAGRRTPALRSPSLDAQPRASTIRRSPEPG